MITITFSYFKEPEYEDIDEIQGIITQIIPPEKHNKYMLSGMLKHEAKDKYIVNVDVSDHDKLIDKIPGPWNSYETKTLIMNDLYDFEEGDEVSVPVKPVYYRMEKVFQLGR